MSNFFINNSHIFYLGAALLVIFGGVMLIGTFIVSTLEKQTKCIRETSDLYVGFPIFNQLILGCLSICFGIFIICSSLMENIKTNNDLILNLSRQVEITRQIGTISIDPNSVKLEDIGKPPGLVYKRNIFIGIVD